MNDLLQLVFSNGFCQLRKFIAIRLGAFETRDTWTGSPALRFLHLNMQTAHDYQRIESLCPNLQKITRGRPSFIRASSGKLLGFAW